MYFILIFMVWTEIIFNLTMTSFSNVKMMGKTVHNDGRRIIKEII